MKAQNVDKLRFARLLGIGNLRKLLTVCVESAIFINGCNKFVIIVYNRGWHLYLK